MKKGGSLVFREPLSSDKKLQMLKKLAGQNGLSCETSRITDFPLMGNCMESYYVKFNGGKCMKSS
jgi:hypothetical protein